LTVHYEGIILRFYVFVHWWAASFGFDADEVTVRREKNPALREKGMGKGNTYKVDLAVRFRDLDAMGHVNNAVFFTSFEEGRKSFFEKHFSENGRMDFPFILAHAACDFKKPITLTDDIQLQMCVGEIGTRRFDFLYRIASRRDTDTIHATGRSVQVSFDYQTHRTIPLPKHVVECLLTYQTNE